MRNVALNEELMAKKIKKLKDELRKSKAETTTMETMKIFEYFLNM